MSGSFRRLSKASWSHDVFEITLDPASVSEPSTLCKYRSIRGASREWLRRSIVEARHFFPSPLRFNDPFDCRPNFHVAASTQQLRKYFEGTLARHSTLGREERRLEARRRASDPEFDPRVPKNVAEFNRLYTEAVTARVGVFCLSEVCDDLLMWAHYADSHTGVCLIFQADDPFFAPAQPVLYTRLRPTVNPILDSHEEMLDRSLLSKSEHWAYEKEWRIIQYTGGSGEYVVPSPALTGVVLGCQISSEDEGLVRSWVSLAPSKPALMHAQASSSEFKLEIEIA